MLKIFSPRTLAILERLSWLAGVAATFLGGVYGAKWVAVRLHLSLIAGTALGSVIILLIGVVFALVDGGGPYDLGLRKPWKAADAGLAAGIVMVHFSGSMITGILLAIFGLGNLKGLAVGKLFSAFAQMSTGQFLAIALTMALLAGVGEELLFRGYLITRLERLGLGAWPAIVVSGLVFGLLHWPGYGFPAALSKAIWFGIPTGAYFWYRRKLGPLMAAHTLVDFLGFLAAFVLAKLGSVA